jgi:hypothetical protein
MHIVAQVGGDKREPSADIQRVGERNVLSRALGRDGRVEGCGVVFEAYSLLLTRSQFDGMLSSSAFQPGPSNPKRLGPARGRPVSSVMPWVDPEVRAM